MKHLRPLLLLCILAVAISSCKKDKEDPKPEPTKTELLTSKTWKRTGLTVTPRFPADTVGTDFYPNDLYAFLASNEGTCINDNVKKFNINGSFSFEQGATSCFVGAPENYITGTWVLSSNAGTLSLTVTKAIDINYLTDFDYYEAVYAVNAGDYTITKLDATTLEITYKLNYRTNSTSTPITYTFTETLTSQ